ncbi:unnamed protein product [Gongylonema pulchrum]|uniref:WD_REPEATS_REGION domain-containing protein n=1 Tax=Gongylonema pulchrum TaxID=637853 RepID=A0A183ELP5_9BILA|nr:unnamed protein product [Gongylonema pulchrum]
MSKRQLDEAEIGASLPADGGDSGRKKSKKIRTKLPCQRKFSSTDFIITASIDGHLKFWKKKHGEGIGFVKHFRCHLRSFFFFFLISLVEILAPLKKNP